MCKSCSGASRAVQTGFYHYGSTTKKPQAHKYQPNKTKPNQPTKMLFEGFLEYTSASIRKFNKNATPVWEMKKISTFSAGSCTGGKFFCQTETSQNSKQEIGFFRHRGCLYRVTLLCSIEIVFYWYFRPHYLLLHHIAGAIIAK